MQGEQGDPDAAGEATPSKKKKKDRSVGVDGSEPVKKRKSKSADGGSGEGAETPKKRKDRKSMAT
jgi:hypothetical protein